MGVQDHSEIINFILPDHETFGLLRLTPERISLVSFPAPSHALRQHIWRSRPTNDNQ